MSVMTQQAPASDGPGHPLTIAKLAKVLGVSRSTVYRSYQEDLVPTIRVRGAVRVNGRFADDLLAALSAGRVLVFEDFAVAWKAAHPEAAKS